MNLDVPTFTFGTESYSRIGMTSNGYAVIGGGHSTDVEFDPQSLPDPARPNNVLAPFWTDLNPGTGPAGSGLRAAVLSDGVNRWLVLEWERVPTFGTAQLQSFQIWIQTNLESVTYAYGLVTGSGSPEGFDRRGREPGRLERRDARFPRPATTSRSSRARRFRAARSPSRTTRSAGGWGRTWCLRVSPPFG